jgi:hypothetical protein
MLGFESMGEDALAELPTTINLLVQLSVLLGGRNYRVFYRRRGLTIQINCGGAITGVPSEFLLRDTGSSILIDVGEKLKVQ